MDFLYRVGARVYDAVAALPQDLALRTFRSLLNQTLAPYLKDRLRLEDLEAHFRDGVFSFSELQLEEEVITRKLGAVNMTCRFARIEGLTVVAPYDLENDDLSVTVAGLTLVLSTSDNADLFRCGSSSPSASMMGSFMQDDDEMEASAAESVDTNVYMELQENIADLLSTMRLSVTQCRVILENDKRVFELLLDSAELFDSRESETYTIVAEDTSLASVCLKLGVDMEDISEPAVFAPGQLIKVPQAIDGVTQTMMQKSIRYHGIALNFLEIRGPVGPAVEGVGAGEELLALLDDRSAEKVPVLQYGDDVQDELLFIEYSDKAILVNGSLLSSTLKLVVSRPVFNEVMKVATSVVRGLVASDPQNREALKRSGAALSEFSVLFHKSSAPINIEGSPLRFASAFSDWSVWSSFAETTLLRVNFAVQKIRVVLDCPTRSVLSLSAAKASLSSIAANASKTDWNVEVDGGIELKLDNDSAAALPPVLAIYPSAMPLCVVGETVMETRRLSTLITVEHCPGISAAMDWSVFGALQSIFTLDQPMGPVVPQSSSTPPIDGVRPRMLTFQIKWPDMSVRCNSVDLSATEASILFELSPNRRARLEVGHLSLRQEERELVGWRDAKLLLSWNVHNSASERQSTSVPLANKLDSLISVPFGGATAIWGLSSENIKITPSFVKTFSTVADASDLHVDLLCSSFMLSIDQSTFHTLVRMLPPAAEDIMWVTWGMSASELVLSLTHESQARFDYCFSDMVSFGSTGHQHQDSNFVLLDGKRAQIFACNPQLNLSRELLWQKVGDTETSNSEEDHLNSIELANQHTVVACHRLTLSRGSDLRIVFRDGAFSPDYQTLSLAADFWTDHDAQARETEPVFDGEVEWKLQLQDAAVIVQARQCPTRSHAILTCPSLEVRMTASARAWQLSGDIGPLRLFVTNSDTLPSARRYARLGTRLCDDGKDSPYRLLMAMQGINLGLMHDEALSVSLINLQDRPVLMTARTDSMSLVAVLFTNWLVDATPVFRGDPSPFGSIRSDMDQSATSHSLLESDLADPLTLQAASTAASSPKDVPRLASIPSILSPATANLDVRVFLVETRDEYPAGATVRVRWEYRRGAPLEFDWVGLYKTTRSKRSKNYYAYSLTDGKKFGVLEFQVPRKMGHCHFRFFRGAGLDNIVALSESFRVGPLVELDVTRVRGSLYVQRRIVKNQPSYGWSPKPTDWVGLYRLRESNKNRPFQSTFKKVGSSLDTVSFDVPSSPGLFVFRYFADMGWGQSSELARSAPFEVSEHDAQQHELVGRSAGESQPRQMFQISNLNLRCVFTGGHDWDDGRDTANVGAGPPDEVELEFQMPMATYSVMGFRAKHSVTLHASVAVLEIHDRVSRSNYRSVLCFPKVKRVQNAPCVLFQLGKLRGADAENQWQCRVDVAPLWLNIDQDTLMFMLRFAVTCYETIGSDLFLDMDGGELDPMMESFIMVRSEHGGGGAEGGSDQDDEDALPNFTPPQPPEMTFETLSLSGIDVEIDFRAKGRRMDTLLSKHRGVQVAMYRVLYWVSGLVSVNESHLKLETLLLKQVPLSQISDELMSRWFPQIKDENISSLLSGYEPIKFVFRIGEASVSLVQSPVDEYREGGSVLSGLAEGSKELGKTIYVETFRNLSNLLVGTGNVMKNVSKLAETGSLDQQSTKSAVSQHIKAHSPASASEGLELAAREIMSGFGEGFYGAFVAPFEADSATDGLIQVVRGAPGIILRPASAILRGVSIPLRQMASAGDPSISERALLKYKRPSLAHLKSPMDDVTAREDERDPKGKEEENVDDL